MIKNGKDSDIIESVSDILIKLNDEIFNPSLPETLDIFNSTDLDTVEPVKYDTLLKLNLLKSLYQIILLKGKGKVIFGQDLFGK